MPYKVRTVLENARRWLSIYTALWLSALLLYGLGDLVTTQLVFAGGGRELNPILGATVLALGGGLWSLAVVKIVVLSCLMALSLLGYIRPRWAVPGLLSLVGVGLIVNNLVAYGGL